MPIESEPIVNILDPETIVNISETDVNCESQEANIELDMIRNRDLRDFSSRSRLVEVSDFWGFETRSRSRSR